MRRSRPVHGKNSRILTTLIVTQPEATPVHEAAGVRELASGMRQLAGTITRNRKAHAAPFAGLISGRAKYIMRNYLYLLKSPGFFA